MKLKTLIMLGAVIVGSGALLGVMVIFQTSLLHNGRLFGWDQGFIVSEWAGESNIKCGDLVTAKGIVIANCATDMMDNLLGFQQPKHCISKRCRLSHPDMLCVSGSDCAAVSNSREKPIAVGRIWGGRCHRIINSVNKCRRLSGVLNLGYKSNAILGGEWLGYPKGICANPCSLVVGKLLFLSLPLEKSKNENSRSGYQRQNPYWWLNPHPKLLILAKACIVMGMIFVFWGHYRKSILMLVLALIVFSFGWFVWLRMF
ncbi:MAG: hypothetical protein ABSF10_20035 [Verrucomicrobiota bacterium]